MSDGTLSDLANMVGTVEEEQVDVSHDRVDDSGLSVERDMQEYDGGL